LGFLKLWLEEFKFYFKVGAVQLLVHPISRLYQRLNKASATDALDTDLIPSKSTKDFKVGIYYFPV